MGKLTEDAIKMYDVDYFSLEMIGDMYGVSRQAVKKYLNRRGVDTSKRRVVLVCSECGCEFERHRAYIRNTYRPTCSVECYHARIHNSEYNQNRQGQRVARKVADEILIQEGKRLGEKNIVHHEDGDTTNNSPENLIVFKNQSDHMVWHRGDKSKVQPICIGEKVEKKPKHTRKNQAGVAPMVEQGFCKPTVEGSSPSIGPKKVIKTVEDIPSTFRSYSKADQLGKKK